MATLGITAAMDRELDALHAARFPNRLSAAEQELARHLKAVAESLQAASRAAVAAGYGDQFTASLGETFAQLAHTRGMLS